MDKHLKSGFAPVVDKRTVVVVVGSLPSDRSIAKQEYYGNRGNDFWRLMGEVLQIDLVSEPYHKKIDCLLRHKIGLWDVFKDGVRRGSLDTDLHNPEMNDFKKLRLEYPLISMILLNGKTAGTAEKDLATLGFKVKVLLSSSGANRRNAHRRLNQWLSSFNELQL